MGDDDREEAAFDDAAFGDAEGFEPLSGELRPEVRDLAEALRRLLKGSGKSRRQYAVCHHIGVSTVSRYLSGERIPDKHFLDGLMTSACKAHGREVSAALQGRMYRLHRDALLAEDPARYREQMASDRLEDAVLREEEAQLEIRELRRAAQGQKQQLWALESQLRQLKAAEQQERGLLRADPERHRMREEELEEACARLRDKVARLEKALEEAERERDAARTRCRELEAELAAQLAVDEALLRSNVNAMFINLSHRSQGLIEGQLSLLAELESREADPDRLESLFKLDHLATRMRRNCENLLVLAGDEPGRSWTQPVALVDVFRAAASEVEQYERIELTGVPTVEVVGRVVTDLVHLLAELFENATSFSSPQTKVKVTGHALPDGRVLIEIHDTGVGLSPEDLAEVNELLASPPPVDVPIARRMGLFLVARLSRRHGIRTQLGPSDTGGTTALVMLPIDAGEFVPEQPYVSHLDHGGGQLPTATAHLFTICDSGHLSIERPHP
ncbi:ATP-binding protein [Streptomyces diastatochromogenes]|uniref:ATP-binding protein n=1 Tax=Streptomyces diastatochromogenes TaxID=42236 RepID=UPI00367944B1